MSLEVLSRGEHADCILVNKCPSLVAANPVLPPQMIMYKKTVYQEGLGKRMDAVYRWMCAHYVGLLSLDGFLQRNVPC